jgi:hypothetical protein
MSSAMEAEPDANTPLLTLDGFNGSLALLLQRDTQSFEIAQACRNMTCKRAQKHMCAFVHVHIDS